MDYIQGPPPFPVHSATELSERARRALLKGDRHRARTLAFNALAADAKCTLGWLILAALATGPARAAYLRQILSLQPDEPHALQGLAELGLSTSPESVAPTSLAPSTRVPQASGELAALPHAPQATTPSIRTGWRPVLRRAAGQVVLMLLTLLAIAYLTSFGLIMAERGRQGLPAGPLDAATQAFVRTGEFVVQHPATYLWSKVERPAFDLVWMAFVRSAGLLGLSLLIAAALGLPFGILAAGRQRRFGSGIVRFLSLVGMSTPSFLLGMLLWIVDIWFFRTTGLKGLPTTGFGWDAHIILPALVLAARPLAQITQVTYVTLSGVVEQDFIRTAMGKGMRWRTILSRHALPNVWIPVLTTLTTSLRLSLASLPVVEAFFLWPGLGLVLLQAIDLGMSSLVMDLIAALGFLFLLLGLMLDFIYPLLDPRLRQDSQVEDRTDRLSPREALSSAFDIVASWLRSLPRLLPRRSAKPQALTSSQRPTQTQPMAVAPRYQTSAFVRSALTNPALILGSLLLIGFLGLAVIGDQVTHSSAYETHGALMIDGVIGAPPFPPSSRFPWGTDAIGRDLQGLVFSGARQTLTLAIVATLARLLLGTALGLAAGWWRFSWLDRLLASAIAVWAAFPVTLFAMILVLALGIQQGIGVFVIALCVVGWGEVAQLVRGLVVSLKSQPFVEAARSIGSRTDQIILHEILPSLIGPLLVTAALEAAGVLMLLAELGFLNVFVGGGFLADLMEVGKGRSLMYFFSDVPEWGALMANIRLWWRGSPWLGWYPGIAFFLSILAFNLWGDGLRRFLEDTRINVSRWVNRYSIAVLGVGALVLVMALNSLSPMTTYRPTASQFDPDRAMADIQALASIVTAGRETGTPGAALTANYIAERMRAIGLQPAGEHETYLQALVRPRFHLTQIPSLELLNLDGSVGQSFVYRQDYSEDVLGAIHSLNLEGPVVGCVTGPYPQTGGPAPPELGGQIVIVLEGHNCPVSPLGESVALVVPGDDAELARKYLYPASGFSPSTAPVVAAPGEPSARIPPAFFVSRETAEELLRTAGSSLAELEAMQGSAGYGEWKTTQSGANVRIHISGSSDDDPNDVYYNVIGYIPGAASHSPTGSGPALDSLVVMISAYFDGLGVEPDGTLYPGANDNASGVGTMLELARSLKNSPFEPKKTVVFVAWSGGERGDGLGVNEVMNAMTGFNNLTVEAVIELSGVGAGTGDSIALGQGSSYRLIQLFQEAAGSLGGPSTTTRGRGPHFGLPTQIGFGGRSATSLFISWDGSDATSHTTSDTVEAIDPQKLYRVGETTLLTSLILCREVKY